jgi:iron complex outermembrane receptor protein
MNCRRVPAARGTAQIVPGAALIAAGLAAAISPPANAAAGAAPADQSAAGQLEEVVVTANKRSERMQDVPIAISAISSEQLAGTGIVNTTDLPLAVPGLIMESSMNGIQAHLRGVGTTAIPAGTENSIATYIDGVYILSMSGAMLQLSNIEQVEVDKGPQGTLFGRNATGGVIVVRTKDPQQAPGGNAEVTYGNYQTGTGSFYVTGGITPTLAADLSAFVSIQNDGWGKNLFNGEDVNREDEYVARTKWLWTPSDVDTLRFTADFSRSQGDWLNAQAPVRGHPTNYGPGLTTAGQRPDMAQYVASGALNAGAIVGEPFVFNGNFWDIDSYTQPRYSFNHSGVSAEWEHAFDSFRVQSISAYRGAQKDQSWGTRPVPAFTESAGWKEREWQASEELQIASGATSKLKWVGGLYYLKGSAAYDPFLIDGTSLFPAQQIEFLATETTESIAGFGQATIPLTTDTNLTLGLRYTSEKRAITGSTIISLLPFIGAPDIVTGLTDADKTFSKLTWRASLDHRFNDNVMAYISDNRGFKSGIYNTIPPGGPTAKPVAPEVLDAYEIGAKTDWLDRRLRFNVAAFYYNYSQLQVTVFTQTSAEIETGAKAEIYGLDADLVASVTENFRLSAGLSALKSKFKDYPQAQFLVPEPLSAGGGNNPISQSAAGNQLPYAPELVANLGAEYVVGLPGGTSLTFNANFYHSDKWFAGPDNILAQPSYQIVNARVTWALVGEKTRIGIWGKNLTNEKYYAFLSAGNNPGGYDEGTVSPPRTYGISLQHKF